MTGLSIEDIKSPESLEYNLAEARTSKDQAKIIAAREELKQFRKDYMWQEFVPEFYESDKVYDEIIEGYDAATSKKIAMEAYSDRANALDDYNNLLNEFDDELSRFENHEAIRASFRKFKQLSSLVYEDGTPKVDDPKKGIFDLSKAKVLSKVSKAKGKFYEFVPLQKSLETAYNEFVNNLATEGIQKDTKEFDKKVREWQSQNLSLRFDPKYAERRTELTSRLGELQAKMNLSFDIAGAYSEINDLVFTYRDELGQPIAPELGEDKIKRIRDLEQETINFRETLAKNTGLTQEETGYLNSLTAMVKRGTELTNEQKSAMVKLLQRQAQTGLSVAEAAELNNIFAELGDLSEKVPTDYYMDALNFHLSRLKQGEVKVDDVKEFINSDEFQELLDEDDSLREWFELNHVVKKRKKDNAVEIIYEFSYANRITVPVNKDYILTTKIKDNETGEEITFNGVPNARHSRYQVKNEFRTIPIGESWDKYVGQYVDNKGNYLPRLFDPSSKYSAKSSRFMNQRFFDLKRSNNAEFKLLEEMKKFHLGVQKGQSNYSKLYLDMPRFAVKAGDIYQAMQRGKIGERFKNFNEWRKQLVGKSTADFERGYNYDAKNNLVNTDLKGNEITYVPVEGIYNLDIANTDADIITGLFRYGMSIKTQGKLLESLPIVEKPCTVDELKKIIHEYMAYYSTVDDNGVRKYKKTLISLDHSVLVKKAQTEKDKNEMLNNLGEAFTELKRKYPIAFIILSQLNRNIDNPERSEDGKYGNYVLESDIFGADALLQHADTVVGINRPAKQKIRFYGPDRYIIENDRVLVLHFLKCRNGDTRMSFFKAEFEKMSISEMNTPAQQEKRIGTK